MTQGPELLTWFAPQVGGLELRQYFDASGI